MSRKNTKNFHHGTWPTIQPGQRYSWLKLSPYLNFKLLIRRPGVIRDREKEGGRGRNSREKIPGTKLRRIVGIETRAWIHIGWEYFVGIPPTSIESLFAPNTGVTWALKFVSYFADTEQSYRREKFSGHQLSFLVWFIVYCWEYIIFGMEVESFVLSLFYNLSFLLLFWFNFFFFNQLLIYRAQILSIW